METDAVKVPSEGQLVGAGYIDVEFDNSMEGYTYTVYLDGKPVYWNGNDIVREELGEKRQMILLQRHLLQVMKEKQKFMQQQ